MLSRVADNLYWMSRYLERAEHAARMVDVTLYLTLDRGPQAAWRYWRLLHRALRLPAPGVAGDVYEAAAGPAFDHGHPDSIVSCIAAARENARQVREQISSEMWEHVNRLYLQVSEAADDLGWHARMHEFCAVVKDGSHLFQGLTDATMSHGEGWQFLQIGRYLERAGATATLLDVHIAEAAVTADSVDAYAGLVALLRSCAAFEAYCREYTAELHAPRIAEFVLLSPEFPRSVRFAAARLERALTEVARGANRTGAGRAERLAGRLRAALDYAQLDEIMADSIHEFLDTVVRQCAQVHAALYQTYISYPADTALPA